jgi:isopentenyl diphosphate isomerase/L-lactate dehydrogenase-like FMN-dependent dehydrogenase
MNRERAQSEALIKRVEREGFTAIMLTVDAAVPGKREKDQRAKGNFAGTFPTSGKGVAHVSISYSSGKTAKTDFTLLCRPFLDIKILTLTGKT